MLLEKMKNRYTILGFVLFLLFSGLASQLALLQIRNGEAYARDAEERKVRTLTVQGPRGMILDRYGRVLAGNRLGYKVELHLNEVPKEKLNDTILKTINLIENSGDSYEDNLPIQYWQTNGRYEWNTEDIAAWKDKNQIALEASAEEALSVMRKQYGISDGLSKSKVLPLVALRLQIEEINLGNPNEIVLAEAVDSSLLPKMKDLVSQFSELLSLEEVTVDSKTAYSLNVYPYSGSNDLFNTLVSKILDIVPSENLPALKEFPMVLYANNTVDWSTRQIRAWKRDNKIQEEYSAAEAFTYLSQTKYKLDPELSPQDMRKVLSIRLAITQLGYLAYQPVLIANDIGAQTVASIEEHGMDLPGIVVESEYIREYPYGSLLSPSLGYIGKITAEQAETYKEKGYNLSSDLVGRTGLESTLEEYLRGQSGKKQVEINKMGRTIRELSEDPSVPGNNVVLTIDAKVQKAAEDAMVQTLSDIQTGAFGESFPNAKIGAAVAIDIKTGEVIALVSYPNYDPNLFASGTIDNETWKELNPEYPHPKYPNREDLDPTLPRPMLNNAITAAFPPGSTFKMIVGAAGMQEKVVGVTEKILDQGRYTKYSHIHGPACWRWNDSRLTHGWEDIIGALRDSCNYYFYEVGDRLGIEKIEEYAKMFGLGVKSGIEIPGESAGNIAGKEFTNRFLTAITKSKIQSAMEAKLNRNLTEDENKEASNMANTLIQDFSIQNIRKEMGKLGYEKNDPVIWDIYSYINDNRWTPSKTLNASIGQGEHNYTPLQMANYIAALVNGKNRYVPHIISKVENPSGKTLLEKTPEVAQEINLEPDIHQAILEGMGAVTSNIYQGADGTAAKYFKNFPVQVGGKTGTAQYKNPYKNTDSYAWFVGFAPYDDPQIAVAVVIGQGGHGAYAAPVAKAIIGEYLGIYNEGNLQAPNSLQP